MRATRLGTVFEPGSPTGRMVTMPSAMRPIRSLQLFAGPRASAMIFGAIGLNSCASAPALGAPALAKGSIAASRCGSALSRASAPNASGNGVPSRSAFATRSAATTRSAAAASGPRSANCFARASTR